MYENGVLDAKDGVLIGRLHGGYPKTTFEEVIEQIVVALGRSARKPETDRLDGVRFICHHCRVLLSCVDSRASGGTMAPSVGSPDPLLITIVLATLAIGLPILMVLSIRFLWDRSLNLGRSKELEKLIWQLHRIASAMEHQMNLSFPAIQPGTEEARDLAFLQQPTAATVADATPTVASAAIPVRGAQQPTAPQPAAQQPIVPAPGPQPSPEVPRHAGVNSMFGF